MITSRGRKKTKAHLDTKTKRTLFWKNRKNPCNIIFFLLPVSQTNRKKKTDSHNSFFQYIGCALNWYVFICHPVFFPSK